MKAINYTPQCNINQGNATLEQKKYKAKYNYSFIPLIIERTNFAVIIRSSYYQLQLSCQDLSQLTGIIFNSLQEVFSLITNSFDNNNYYIKEISNSKLNIIIKIYVDSRKMQKDIELILAENFEDKNSLIKELFNKYNNVENGIKQLKNNNFLLNEENKRLKEDNMNLKNQLQLNQKNTMNNFEDLQMKIMNAFNMINELKMTLNQIQEKSNMNFMNNFQGNNMIPMSQSNNEIQYEKNIMSVIFYCQGIEAIPRKCSVFCKPDDLVSDLLEKYKKKIGFKFDENELRFSYNAQTLNKKRTIKESGIINNSIIYVYYKNNIVRY